MIFASPIWLLSLAPWMALTIWLMIGRNPRAIVPFIDLWRSDETSRRQVRRSFRIPPMAIVTALIALLLALLAAARPMIRSQFGERITIILDRGVTMSGKSIDDPRWDAMLSEIRNAITEKCGAGPLDLITVPSGQSQLTDRSNWNRVARDTRPTGLNTREAMIENVNDALRHDSNPIIVISNQKLPESSPRERMVQLAPARVENVGIVAVSARESPRPSVMVEIRDQSKRSQPRPRLGAMKINSTLHEIDLPPTDGERDFFFDLDRIDDVISIELQVDDDLAADNRAWLVRAKSWPRLEGRSGLSPELSRMIKIYSRHRPPAENSRSVVITDNLFRAPSDQPALIVPSASAIELNDSSKLQIANHPLTEHVRDWNDFVAGATVAEPPGEGWTPILSTSAPNAVLVAVREKPARQVWVGFHSPQFARSPQFVVFWSDVFDWLAGASQREEFRCDPVTVNFDGDVSSWQRVTELSGDPTTAAPAPGVYRGPNGELRAASALDLKIASADSPSDWRNKLAALAHSSARTDAKDQVSGRDLSPPMLLASLSFLALAALLWGEIRMRKTPQIMHAIDAASR